MQRNFLFIHQNFPGQFQHVAAELVRQGHRVVALGMSDRQVPKGVHYLRYGVQRLPQPSALELVRDFEVKVQRANGCARAMLAIQAEGFRPDVIVGHPGWGELLFCRDIWPGVPLLVFAEFYYRCEGSDYAFDPEFRNDTPAARSRLRLKNTVHLHALSEAEGGYAPTHWQHAQLPREYASKFRVIFDGIDTQVAAPDEGAFVDLAAAGLHLTRADEVITFVNRNLEPYRGFHVFMRALPRILRERPRAHCVIVGGPGVSYGSAPPGGGSWREVLLRELEGQLPLERIHFVGKVAYADYLRLLQVSTCHVYLTYPFVLSWSMLEAMSAGCVVVGSRTAPVEEVIIDGENGLLFDFFDREALAARVVEVLGNRAAFAHLGVNARRTVVQRYDLRTVCLPQQLDLLLQAASAAAGSRA